MELFIFARFHAREGQGSALGAVLRTQIRFAGFAAPFSRGNCDPDSAFPPPAAWRRN